MVNLQACNRQTALTAPPFPSTQLVAAPGVLCIPNERQVKTCSKLHSLECI